MNLFIESDMSILFLQYISVSRTPIYWIFIVLVMLDIVTGTLKGVVNKEANSTKGLFGLIKHLLVVVLVLIVTPFLMYLGLNTVAQSFIVFFIVQYGISLVENWGQLGLPLPEWVVKFFDKLNKETNEIEMKDAKIVIKERKED